MDDLWSDCRCPKDSYRVAPDTDLYFLFVFAAAASNVEIDRRAIPKVTMLTSGRNTNYLVNIQQI